MGLVGDGVLCLIQAVVFVYDIVTSPLYTVTQRPWVVRESHNKIRSQTISEDEQSVTIKANYRMTKPLQVYNLFSHFFLQCKSYILLQRN